MTALILGIPSKGRLMEQSEALFASAGLAIIRSGDIRGYQGSLSGIDGVEIAFLSAPEIAVRLFEGSIHAGITGEDLLQEKVPAGAQPVTIAKRLGFGRADVVVAVPACWLDVDTMADLDEVSVLYHDNHNLRLRVATKYLNITRRFFAEKGVTGYRIAESLGATEGAPAAGTAQVIVDITSTGSTLKANHLKVLDDGVILKSEACLAAAIHEDHYKNQLDQLLSKI